MTEREIDANVMVLQNFLHTARKLAGKDKEPTDADVEVAFQAGIALGAGALKNLSRIADALEFSAKAHAETLELMKSKYQR